jgi:hypothetical protein
MPGDLISEGGNFSAGNIARRLLTKGLGRSKLLLCAQKSWLWRSSSDYPMMLRCTISLRNFMPPQSAKDWKSWIAARASAMTRSDASSNHGLPNNLGSASTSGPSGDCQLHSSRQTRCSTPVWRKTDRRSRESLLHAGTRPHYSKTLKPCYPGSARSALSHRIPDPAEPAHRRNCAYLARSQKPSRFRTVTARDFQARVWLVNEHSK